MVAALAAWTLAAVLGCGRAQAPRSRRRRGRARDVRAPPRRPTPRRVGGRDRGRARARHRVGARIGGRRLPRRDAVRRLRAGPRAGAGAWAPGRAVRLSRRALAHRPVRTPSCRRTGRRVCRRARAARRGRDRRAGHRRPRVGGGAGRAASAAGPAGRARDPGRGSRGRLAQRAAVLGRRRSVGPARAGGVHVRGLRDVSRLAPAVEHFARDPLVALRRFDERRDTADGGRWTCPAARTRWRWDSTGRCWPRERSTRWASSRACWPRRNAGTGRRPTPRPLRGAPRSRARLGVACSRARARPSLVSRPAGWWRRRSSRATPRPTTSAGTPTRRPPAHTRPACRASTSTATRCALGTAGRSTTSGVPSIARPPGGRARPPLRDPDGHPLPERPAHEHLPGRRAATDRLPHAGRRLLVPLLRRHVRRLMDCCAYHATASTATPR